MRTYHPFIQLGAVVVGLGFGQTATACIQGYHLPPGKRLVVPVPADANIAARRFEPRKIELPASGDLIAAVKTEIAVPKLEVSAIDFAPIPVFSGQPATGKRPEMSATTREPLAAYARIVREFETRPARAAASFEDTTDYGVALIYLGRPAQAIAVLLALEAMRPGVYTTASNLGTAYELTGNLEMAVKWIGEGVARNATSHDGTEWLHLAILRAKIQLRSDKVWLARHSVLDVADKRDAAEIVRAIEYQLNERLNFVQPTDGVVCDLFYQAARLLDGVDNRERRAHYLRESLRFGEWRKVQAADLAKS